MPPSGRTVTADAWVADAIGRSRWLQSLALALVRDPVEADDLVQETWLRALAHPPAQRESWRIWIERVLRNLVAERQRRNFRFASIEKEALLPKPQGTPEETALRLETQHALTDALLGLPEPYRTTLQLHYYDQWTLRQLARREGVATRAIETRLRRGRAMLRAELAKRGPLERWAHGLLLLAWPGMGASTGLVAGLSLGGVAAAVLAGAWWIGQSGSVTSDAGASPAAAAANQGGAIAAAAGAASGSAAIERTTLQLTPFALASATDAESNLPLEGAELRAEFLDSAKRVIHHESWISRAEAELLAVPRGAALARILGGSTRTHGAPDGGRLFPWEAEPYGEAWVVPLAPRRGILEGSLVREDGAAVAGGLVGVWAEADALLGRPPLWTEATDAAGRFRIERCKARGQALLLAPVDPTHAVAQDYRLREDLAESERVTGILLVQSEARRTAWNVRDTRGAPIAGARLRWQPLAPTEARSAPSRGVAIPWPEGNAVTDAEGASSASLAPGKTYAVTIEAPGFVTQTVICEPFETQRTVQLERDRHFPVVARDESGAPVAGDGDETGAPKLRADGSIRIRLLTEDGSPWPNDREAWAQLSGGPLVRRTGESEPREVDEALAHGQISWVERLALQGSYAQDNLAPGRYRIAFSDPDGLIAETEVEAGEAERLVRAGTFVEARGTLFVRVAPAAGADPVAERSLHWSPCERGGAVRGSHRKVRAGTDATRVSGLEAMEWEVRVIGAENEAVWVAPRVSVARGDVVDLHAIMRPGMSGRLRLLAADGQPVRGVAVRVLDGAGRSLPLASELAQSDDSGWVHLAGMPLDANLAIEVRDGERTRRLPPGVLNPALREWIAVLPD